MSETQKYYWLKLKEDFFAERAIKKLRKIAGGDTFTIIYLKMQLLSIKMGGMIKFEGTENTIEEQLELQLDESIEDIRLTLAYLTTNNLIEKINDTDYLLNAVPHLIGKETDAAQRMRKMRNKSKQLEIGIESEAQSQIEEPKEDEKPKDKTFNKNAKIVFDHWNSKKIIVHKDLTNEIEDKIKEKLKSNMLEEILLFIDRYATVINDDTYFFNYKWSLLEFFKRKDGIKCFTDDGSKWINYLEHLKTSKKTGAKTKSNLSDEEMSAFGGGK